MDVDQPMWISAGFNCRDIPVKSTFDDNDSTKKFLKNKPVAKRYKDVNKSLS